MTLLYIGTYTETIHLLRLDARAGTISEVAAFPSMRNPAYLTLDGAGRVLYAVNELGEYAGRFGGAASAFAVDPANGHLTWINTVPTHGADPCHLAVHPAGRHLLVANYTSGHVTTLPIGEDGALGEATQTLKLRGASVHPTRQTGPHAHCVTPDATGAHVFVADLGADRVHAFGFDAGSGMLRPHDPAGAAAPPGAGPRQIRLHPRWPFAYVINELASSVTVHGYDAGAAALQARQTISTLPDDVTVPNSCAELRIGPSGHVLYASNRGHDSIAVFAIAPDTGLLSPIGHVATGGATPRSFALSPDGGFLVAANQRGDGVVLFRVDEATGMPSPVGSAVAVRAPVCVCFRSL